ncbi:HET-domain-containing protein, partial [Amniculicola lignicola CBS 123094]
MDWRQQPESCSLENDVVYNTFRLSREEALRLGIIQDVPTDAPVRLSDLPEFEYTSLPDNQHFIRILCLEGPRQVSGYHRPTIPCVSVLCAPLDEETPFFALSYVWGDPSKKSPIILNDCIFWVTESLAGAIERFQEPDRILLLWADAVCINQKDLEEKGAQVQEMGNIYRNAQLVLGWIGPAADDSELALRSILQLFEDALPADKDDLDKAFPTAAVIALCSRAWWGRIWVLQEVVLAKNIHV